VVHPANEPTHASDVALANSQSDVKLAESVSDVKLADSLTPSEAALANAATGAAPSFRMPAPPSGQPKTIELKPPEKRLPRDGAAMALLPGARIDDFEVVKLLGKGAFGHVYMARQISLDRHVALKISANRGSEGRTMARLEHQHIVQVFSETEDADFNQRLLCMQLIPGMGLEKLIGLLHSPSATTKVEARSEERGASKESANSESPAPSPEPHAAWGAAELLAFMVESGSMPTALDTSALHDREALGKMDDIEATAWFGARLAEALDFAHRHGVLHRD